MKKLILCLFLAFTSLVPAFAKAGYETHGGDAICAEFMEAFDAIVETLNNSNLNAIEKGVVDSLVAKRQVVQLSSKPELFLDGVEKDAINYSGDGLPKIEISQKSWARLTKDQKSILVLHEILPIAGFNDKDYSISLNLYKIAYGNNVTNTKNFNTMVDCDVEGIQKLTPADFQPLASEDMEGWAIASKCVPAMEALAAANWNFNKCNLLDETAMTRAISALELEMRMKSIGRDAENMHALSIRKYERLIEIIRENGGTATCNGHYDFPKRRYY